MSVGVAKQPLVINGKTMYGIVMSGDEPGMDVVIALAVDLDLACLIAKALESAFEGKL